MGRHDPGWVTVGGARLGRQQGLALQTPNGPIELPAGQEQGKDVVVGVADLNHRGSLGFDSDDGASRTGFVYEDELLGLNLRRRGLGVDRRRAERAGGETAEESSGAR